MRKREPKGSLFVIEGSMKFIDEVEINVASGHGGAGALCEVARPPKAGGPPSIAGRPTVDVQKSGRASWFRFDLAELQAEHAIVVRHFEDSRPPIRVW